MTKIDIGRTAASRDDQGDGEPLATLKTGVNQLLDLFYDKIGKHHHAVSGHVSPEGGPPAEVSGSDDDMQITLELPGLDETDFEVLVEDEALIVRGERSESKERKEANYSIRERSYGRFERRFAVPSYFDGAKARAIFDKGLLTVTLPRKAGQKRRAKKIPVKSK